MVSWTYHIGNNNLPKKQLLVSYAYQSEPFQESSSSLVGNCYFPEAPRFGKRNFLYVMAYNKITDFHLNEGNPFLPATVVHVEKGEKTLLFGQKNADLIIDNEGSVKGHSLFARKVQVDKAKFMKVFMTGLTNWFDLSKPAIKVFAYIAETLEPNRDNVEFSLEKCKAFTGFKAQKTILSALAELAANQFIARGPHPYKYFINPTIFFNGDRLTFIEQYELENKDENLLKEPKTVQESFNELAQTLV